MLMLLFFCYCAVVITGTGLLAVTLRNPVHSVLMVLILFFHMAMLYLSLGAEFLAAVQVIVYAGAILVLYLFVLFLVSLKEELRMPRFVSSAWLGRLIAGGLAACLLYILPVFSTGARGNWPAERVREITPTRALATEMYSASVLPFEIAGLILLVAVIGGLLLARREKDSSNTNG
ncbi:MAG TPA: NADH-ubiquinone/plastoquinone oxidoreductase chain 6 [Desulfobulbus sp.]|nr:NADH-ubiquinone/plastoquinone oxidoreductase chain 6 [Desulfobulbus sp.]